MATKRVKIFCINTNYLYYKEHSVFMKITEVSLLATAKEQNQKVAGISAPTYN
jgi:hypothetical protein